MVGPNGSGKTNFLEAISLLLPGRGIRSAKKDLLPLRNPFSQSISNEWAAHFSLQIENKLKDRYPNIIREVRGRGLLIGLQLQKDQSKFIEKLMDNGLLTIRASENVVRILPPLNVKKIELNQALEIINKVCKNLTK